MKERLRSIPKYKVIGKITNLTGPVAEAVLPKVFIGNLCKINGSVESEVVGFKNGKTLLMTYTDTTGIKLGSSVEALATPLCTGVSKDLPGTVMDPFGNPLNKRDVTYTDFVPLKKEPINPLERERIKEPIDLGIRSINALLTVGKGQRIGIFSGAGVGKSTLLGMISRFTSADINIVALIGERGREVKEFIEDNLGEEGLKKSIIVVATSDQPPLAKIRAAHVACSIAEYFSHRGADVTLLLDSLTRLAMAQREIGLATGEPATTKGYTPSVFSLISRIVERAGNFAKRGSITGIYTVLVEGDDISFDPIADACVSFLDGHIILSRELANRRIYPSIDVLKSVSRLNQQITNEEILKLQSVFTDIESVYQENKEMINLGLYKKGTSPKVDLAIKVRPEMESFLKQDMNEKINLRNSIAKLKLLVEFIKKEGERYGYRWGEQQ